MALELTLQQAREQSANFLYIFATNKYLSYIKSKYAKVIKVKRANEIKLLTISAEKYLGSIERYEDYKNAVKEGFIETYGIDPGDALVKLALGETVAGKNWEKGVYGIGAIHPTTFKGVTVNGQEVTVDKKTGHIFVGSTDITDTQDGLIYGKVGKQDGVLYQVCSKVVDGKSFMAQYYSVGKTYYAKSYSTEAGLFSANTGATISNTEAGTVWENIKLGTVDFMEWLKTLLSYLGINISTDTTETINAENTLPNQTADGYVTEAGWGEMGTILLATAAGGLLLAGGLGKKGKKSK